MAEASPDVVEDNETVKQLRAALAAAEARAEAAEVRASALDRLFSLVPGTVVEYDQDPTTGMFRPTTIGGAGASAMFLCSNEAVLADPDFFTLNLHPEDAPGVMSGVMAFLEKGQSHLSPHRIKRSDGSYVWLETHFMYTRENGQGKLRAVMFDVTERIKKEHEQLAILASEQKLRQRLDGFVSSVPGIVWESYFVKKKDDQQADFVSDSVVSITGYTIDEWMQPNFWVELIIPEDREHAQRESERIVEVGRGVSSYRWRTKDGRIIWVTTQMTTIRDDAGELVGLRGITMDVTEEKRVEAEIAEARLRESVLQAHEESLLALSTPLVPIDDDVLAMTLVGNVDERRAGRVLEALLEGVTRTSARVVILDVTGVPEVNEHTADSLLRAAQAVRLLGAEAVLTGIRPEVARTLVTIGANLGTIITKATLKAGIAYAMTQKKFRR